ncbi:MAG: hypothetical protein KF867_06725 [Cryobacterium sp.]|nr:hypothetical protein [Cryobacterium sp.]
MRKIQRICLISLSLGLSLLLVGCTPPPRTAARIVNGKFVFVSCDGIRYTNLRVYISPAEGKGVGPDLRWSADGSTTILPEGDLVYGDPPVGMKNTFGPEPLVVKDSRVSVNLDPEANSNVSSVWGVFYGNDLSRDYWLRGDGTKNSQACN